jgi:hypothetical protein
MTEEGKLQAKIIEGLEKRFDAFVIKIMRANKAGIPDLYALFNNGYSMFIEVKSLSGKPSKLQLYRIEEIRKRNCCAFVCNNFDDAMVTAELINRQTPRSQ